jgi:hypothetical protein
VDNQSGRQAVFLSYASEDTECAGRLCAALRAAGIEVWLDQNELRGGDLWDAAIRQQIKTCALFVPIISANTRTRAEGYFRLEWKLAVDRSHQMAGDQPFLVPVVIDATVDAEARVPERFREAHWTRLPGGAATAAFVTRVSQLLSVAEVKRQGSSATEPPASARSRQPDTAPPPPAAPVDPLIAESRPPLSKQHTIIGRERELETFNAAFDRMLAGRRQLVLIAGEPGIGKTRCAEALADIAEDKGALVLWGRCHEEAGAPPYWPWVQILRAYIDTYSLAEVRLIMGATTKDIAALIPELLEPSQQTSDVTSAIEDASPARFRAFDAIRQFFQRAAQRAPLTLALEDLHLADAPSLALLEFLSEHLPRGRLLIVGTYRDTHASAKTPLMRTLGGLKRGADVERIHLSRLSLAAIGTMAQQLCSTQLSGPLVKAIHQQTDGNPLFATELIRVLIDEGDGKTLAALPAKIPAGVHETIGRRLLRLSDGCNAILCVAAILGRQFTAPEIAAIMDEDVQRILGELEPALQAAVVASTAEVPGGYQFTHALIRETIYEDLPAVERVRLHARAAAALVAIHSTYLQPVLTRIAHHYYESVTLGHTQEAVSYALLAADSAARMYAFEEAILHYDRTIRTLENAGLRQDARLARAYILKASALKQMGQIPQSVDVLLEAVNRTRVLGSAELLVDLVMLVTSSSRHWPHQHFVPLLERVLEVLPAVDSPARAKALSTLAFAQRTSFDKPRLAEQVEAALAMAERVCDATARCACYELAAICFRGHPGNLQRRLLLGSEHIAVARSTGKEDLLADAYHWQVLNFFEATRIDELEPLLREYGELTAATIGIHQYQVGAHLVTLALLRGEWSGLEERIEGLLEIGTKTRRDDADGVYGAQMFALNRDLGRLHAMAPQIKQIASSTDKRMWEPGLMLMCAEIGLLSEAKAILERLVGNDFCVIGWDDMYMTFMVFCAQTCCVLGDLERARTLYPLLLPYRGQTANHPTAVCFGAVELYLAMLASTANEPDTARAHFDHALATNRAMRAWPALARTLFRCAAFLLARASQADQALGLERLREAERLARRLGMARLVFDIETVINERQADSVH